MDPVAGVHGAAECAAEHRAERALGGQGAALQLALGAHGLPARRPDLVLRQPRPQLLLLVLPARPAQPLPCTVHDTVTPQFDAALRAFVALLAKE